MLSHPAGMSDAELIAAITATDLETARTALAQAGGLRELANTRGSGLEPALELAKRYLWEELRRGDALSSPDATKQFLTARLRDLKSECFACIFLDNRNRVIAFEEIFTGTIDAASVYPREVARRALTHNAAALIAAHNHPSGIPEPSRADIKLTGRLRDALGLLDIRLLDHFVIGDGEAVSFAERGLI